MRDASSPFPPQHVHTGGAAAIDPDVYPRWLNSCGI